MSTLKNVGLSLCMFLFHLINWLYILDIHIFIHNICYFKSEKNYLHFSLYDAIDTFITFNFVVSTFSLFINRFLPIYEKNNSLKALIVTFPIINSKLFWWRSFKHRLETWLKQIFFRLEISLATHILELKR